MDLSTVTSIVFGGRTADTMSIGGDVVWRRPVTLTLTVGTGISAIYYKIGDGSWTSGSGSVTVGYGLTVYMYATASSGYEYTTYSQSNPLTVTMTNAYTYSPIGTVSGYQVILSKDFDGTLRWSGAVSGTSTANSCVIIVPNGQSVQVWASCSDGYYHANINSGNKLTVDSATSVVFKQSFNALYSANGGVVRLNDTIPKFKNQWGTEYTFSSDLATGDYLVGGSTSYIGCYVPQGSTGSVQFAQGQRTMVSNFPISNPLYSSVKTGSYATSGTPTAFLNEDCYLYMYRSGTSTFLRLSGLQYVSSLRKVTSINKSVTSFATETYIPNSFTTYNFYND